MDKNVKMLGLIVLGAIIGDLIVQGTSYLLDKNRNSYDEDADGNIDYEDYINDVS